MIVRHETLWVITVLVLLASVFFSESVKLRKPRKRTTMRIPYQQSRLGPVIIRVMHKYTDDGPAYGSPRGCTNNNCRKAHDKFNLDVNEAISEKDNFLSDEESLRYVVHPEKYEHFVLRKNTGHANRYKRDSARDSSNESNHTVIDRGSDTSNVSRNENKGNFTKVTLHRIPLYKTSVIMKFPIPVRNYSKSLSKVDRMRRSTTADYSSRRNASDYYAQRQAVMERYYARQREINARYANRTNVISRLGHNNVVLSPGNASSFNLGRVYLNKDSTARDSTTFRQLSIKSPIESRYNKIPTEVDSRRNLTSEIDSFKSDADLSQTRNSDNIERNALDYLVTPTPCTNLSSSGTFAPKTRPKNFTLETELGNVCNRTSADNKTNDNTKDSLQWGKCEGKIVYQHNLLLGLKGPSNLDALFEVIIQGPVCITCVEALRYNETRATVKLDSGGRGHEYAKLRLQGYENEGFSYIIKVWGVKKIGQVCDNIEN